MNARKIWRSLSTGLLVLTLMGLLVPGAVANRAAPPPVSAGDPALCQVAVPSGGEVSVLNAVTTVQTYITPAPRRSGTMWAVGYATRQNIASPATATLTLYFDGHKWQIVRSPNLGQENVLTAVSAAKENDVWAVGYAVRDRQPRPLAMHFNGKAWQMVNVPTPDPDLIEPWDIRLTGVQMISGVTDRDAVAVGYSAGPHSVTPLAFHYDGKTWTPMVLPAMMMGGRFTAVAGDSLTNLWAVGTLLGENGQEIAHLFHLTADGWTPIAKGFGLLTGLAIHGDRVFTVGHIETLTGKQTLVMAYTASNGDWTQIESFNQDMDHNFLMGVVTDGGKVYAVGYAGNGVDDISLKPLVLVYTGESFLPVHTPSHLGRVSELYGVTVTNGVLWTVGTTGDNAQRTPLVLTNNCLTNQ